MQNLQKTTVALGAPILNIITTHMGHVKNNKATKKSETKCSTLDMYGNWSTVLQINSPTKLGPINDLQINSQGSYNVHVHAQNAPKDYTQKIEDKHSRQAFNYFQNHRTLGNFQMT